MVTQRTYFVGNSVTDTIDHTGFVDLAASQGHTQIWGRHMIPGAPLSWIWQHPEDGFQEPPYGHYPNALSQYQWDSLSLQPFDRPVGGDSDQLLISKNQFGLTQAIGALEPNSFTVGNQATNATHRFIYDASQGKLSFDPDGNGPTVPRQIAQLLNLPALNNANITVIA